MGMLELVFGARPRPLEVISAPPAGVVWREARARGGAPVSARVAGRNGFILSARGRMRHRAGADYIVEREGGDKSVVSRSVFERTYRQRDDGRWEKRTDVTYRYFTLARAVVVATPEGPQRADAGDWIIQGVDGELWPVTPDRAAEIYTAA